MTIEVDINRLLLHDFEWWLGILCFLTQMLFKYILKTAKEVYVVQRWLSGHGHKQRRKKPRHVFFFRLAPNDFDIYIERDFRSPALLLRCQEPNYNRKKEATGHVIPTKTLFSPYRLGGYWKMKVYNREQKLRDYTGLQYLSFDKVKLFGRYCLPLPPDPTRTHFDFGDTCKHQSEAFHRYFAITVLRKNCILCSFHLLSVH